MDLSRRQPKGGIDAGFFTGASVKFLRPLGYGRRGPQNVQGPSVIGLNWVTEQGNSFGTITPRSQAGGGGMTSGTGLRRNSVMPSSFSHSAIALCSIVTLSEAEESELQPEDGLSQPQPG